MSASSLPQFPVNQDQWEPSVDKQPQLGSAGRTGSGPLSQLSTALPTPSPSWGSEANASMAQSGWAGYEAESMYDPMRGLSMGAVPEDGLAGGFAGIPESPGLFDGGLGGGMSGMAGDFYCDADDICRGVSLAANDLAFDGGAFGSSGLHKPGFGAFDDFGSVPGPLGFGDAFGSSFEVGDKPRVEKFQDNEMPPAMPQDPFFRLEEATTCRVEVSVAADVANRLLDFFDEHEATITKVSRAKFAIKADLATCTLKARLYAQGPRSYAVELQRRSGDCVVFGNTFRAMKEALRPYLAVTESSFEAAPIPAAPLGGKLGFLAPPPLLPDCGLGLLAPPPLVGGGGAWLGTADPTPLIQMVQFGSNNPHLLGEVAGSIAACGAEAAEQVAEAIGLAVGNGGIPPQDAPCLKRALNSALREDLNFKSARAADHLHAALAAVSA